MIISSLFNLFIVFLQKQTCFSLQREDYAMMLLLGWGIFLCLVYLLLWGDSFYYKYNVPKVCKKVLDAFTEEE